MDGWMGQLKDGWILLNLLVQANISRIDGWISSLIDGWMDGWIWDG